MLSKSITQSKTLEDVILAVEKFHDSFGIKNNYKPSVKLDLETIELRHRLIEEENNEYLEAAKNGDIVEVADALGDILYVLCGTLLSHGLQHKIVRVFDEIQASNMSKLGNDGKAIIREDGKVMKGPNYFRPNIKKILEKDL